MTLVQNSSIPSRKWKIIPGWCITVLVINDKQNALPDGASIELKLAANPFLVVEPSVLNLTYSLLPDEVISPGLTVPQNRPIFLAFTSAPS